MIQKQKNGTYLYSISLENYELEVLNQEVLGSFKIEVIEKNYGTFNEDVNLRFNLECRDFKLNNKPMDFYTLDQASQKEISDYLIIKTKKELQKYLFNN